MQHPQSKILAVGLVLFLGARSFAQEEPVRPPPGPRTFETWSMGKLEERRARQGKSYLSFLERSSMRCGLYHLAAGGRDHQSPHVQDEVYYVIAGKSRFTCDGETVDARAGDLLFVAATLEHRFHDIEEDLELLVFFSSGKPMTSADGNDIEDEDEDEDEDDGEGDA